jgi:Domain of unknown function (DUF4253)
LPRELGGTGDAPERFFVPNPGLDGEPAEDLLLLLIPTRIGSEVPAYIEFGGWNACPEPAMQVAFLRKWHREYGAEPVTCGGEVLELRAARRPATAEAALRLAEEHFLYCNDIVEQGLNSIDALADTLMRSSIWFFWWD